MRTSHRPAGVRGGLPKRVALGLALLGLLALAACGGGGGAGSGGGKDAKGNDKIKVGVIPILDVAPIYLGKQKGFFTEQKIDMTLVPGSGGAVAVPGVVSGQLQFAFANVVSLLLAQTQGLPLKVLTSGNASTGVEGRDFGAIVVANDSPIKTAKDLVGKTVAVNNLKNVGDTTVRASIRKAGGDAKNVKFVELGFPDMPAALAKHRIEAAWVVEPFVTIAKQQGARVIAWNLVDTAPKMTIAAYFTTTTMIKQNPDLVKRFTTAMNKSLNYAQAHPDEVRKILPTYTKVPAALIPKLVLPDYPEQVNTASVRTLAKLMQQDGLVKKSPDVDALLP